MADNKTFRAAIKAAMAAFCTGLLLSGCIPGGGAGEAPVEVSADAWGPEDQEWARKEEGWAAREQAWARIARGLLQRDIDIQEDYVTNGMLMQIDAGNCYLGTLKIYVESESFLVLQVLADLLSGSPVSASVAEGIGWTVKDISDLVTVSADQFGHDGYLTVTAYAPGEREAEALLALYKEEYEAVAETIAQVIAGHTDSILECSASMSASPRIRELQEEAVGELQKLKTMLAGLGNPEAVPEAGEDALAFQERYERGGLQ